MLVRFTHRPGKVRGGVVFRRSSGMNGRPLTRRGSIQPRVPLQAVGEFKQKRGEQQDGRLRIKNYGKNGSDEWREFNRWADA